MRLRSVEISGLKISDLVALLKDIGSDALPRKRTIVMLAIPSTAVIPA